MRHPVVLLVCLTGVMEWCAGVLAISQESAAPETPASRYARWKNGPNKDRNYFPVAVWLQDPRNAARYQALGINLYVGLWKGPTAAQIAELKKRRMPVFCAQNEWALAHLEEPTIVGWMHGDEPDNAQSLGKGKGYGPPITPEVIIREYEQMKQRDPTRPVLLNLGQAVAWDGYIGRGVRSRHPEDYAEYVKGSDIVSFDIYPVVSRYPQIAGKLWYVPRGVARLRNWAGRNRLTWNCIECTRISNVHTKPTPAQVKAEVWMSLIHGAQGLIYFVHQFKPKFIEAALLADPEMSAAVGRINRQIHELGAALNSPTLAGAVTVKAVPAAVDPERARLLHDKPVAVMAKPAAGGVYVFAVRMENQPAEATFTLHRPVGAQVEVLGENRTLAAHGGVFSDRFGPYGVHLYYVH